MIASNFEEGLNVVEGTEIKENYMKIHETRVYFIIILQFYEKVIASALVVRSLNYKLNLFYMSCTNSREISSSAVSGHRLAALSSFRSPT